ncbi:MAG TPA: MBL fold metallo-hydrolase [Candidatus Kapabacteria bacterium]|nr:MBL fold metallo-hydrolase [Candidatus Kapabacteria bacterium]
MSESPGQQQEKPKENKGLFTWLRTVWDKMMHDGRGDSIKVRVKRIKKSLSRKAFREDGTMSAEHPVEGAPKQARKRYRSNRHPMRNMVAAGREMGERKREVDQLRRKQVRKRTEEVEELERKPQDFPFSRYFLGGEEPEAPKQMINWREWKNDAITAGWIGHSTVLINFFGKWIMTDPVFSKKTGYDIEIMVVGPTRIVSAAADPADLPRIDLLLLSHAHMDHTDKPSLRKLLNARHLSCAVNTADIYQKLGFQDVQEIEWGNRLLYDAIDLTVEAIEVKHFGWRYPWEPCRGRNEEGGRSFNAFMVEGLDPSGRLRTIVFAGDTAYTPTFKKLGDRLRSEGRTVDLAIMPIGAYEPWIGAHCNPEQAWQMTREMNAECILPVHWNTFIQSAEPRFEPIEWLVSEVEDDDRIVIKEIGETWSTK